MSDTKERFLVTGANGHLGRRAAELLLESGAGHVIAASRHPEKLADLAARGAETRHVDFDDPASLDAALAGVDRVLFISTDAAEVPGQRIRQHKAMVAAAAKAGVRHVVYTSMPNPESSLITFAPDHLQTEQALDASGIAHTILRVNWYAENVAFTLPHALATGRWVTSAGDGRIAFVAREDVARTCAAAITSASSENRRFDVTGSEAFSPADVVALLNDIFGSKIELTPVSDDELAAGLRAAGLPELRVKLLVSMDANTRAGKLDVISDAVERLTGKPPQTLRDFWTAHRGEFATA